MLMLNETYCYKYALQVLSENYISLYIIDLQEDTLYPLKLLEKRLSNYDNLFLY